MAASSVPIILDDCFPGVVEIYEERLRQINQKGRTAEVDDTRINGELGFSAIGFLFAAHGMFRYADRFSAFKYDWALKLVEGKRRMLVKAGALIAAELDRMRRMGE